MTQPFSKLGLALLLLLWAGSAGAGELLVDRSVPSSALGRDLAYNVYLPSGYAESGLRYPTVYLLHGYGGGYHEWRKGGRIEETLDRLIEAGEIAPLIAVMPEAGKSWYVDSARFGGPGDYESAILADLIPAIDRMYPTRAEGRHRAIGGLSMGGHGALRLAFLYPETFSAVAALSPAIWMPDGMSEGSGPLGETPEARERWYPKTTGETFDYETFNAQSPFASVSSLETGEGSLAILLTVGDDDYFQLHDGTVELYIALRRHGLKPELRVADGAHNWAYWRSVMDEMFHFFDGVLNPAE